MSELQSGLVFFFSYVYFSHENATAAALALAIAAGACALDGVRVGTLLAHGFSPRPVWNRMAQILAGSATGTFVLTVIVVKGSELNPAVKFNSLAELWMILLPVLAGLAWVFAEIDSCGYLQTRALPLFGRIGKSLAVLIFASVAAAALKPLWPARKLDPNTLSGPKAMSAAQNVIQLDGEPRELVFPIMDLPQVVPALPPATPPVFSFRYQTEQILSW